MGVPAFFRWLSLRYPKVVTDCVELLSIDADGTELPVDSTAPNPNGTEFDNLYLDMNGIIHPCTHPEDRPAPTTEQEMFQAIFHYVDRIMDIIRPRKLLYMAIDGVAPRAKINQQRSRRFRAAREAEQKAYAEEKIRKEWEEAGLKLPAKDPNKKPFDSNVITPGTPFMSRLSDALKQYVMDRISKNPAWKDIKVIFSDASFPGEGEHKIAHYVRQARLQPGYDPNLKHVLYGLDADLIMLGLATHEVSFSILRETVYLSHYDQKKAVELAQNKQYDIEPDADGIIRGTLGDLGGKKPFQFLHIHILREYLEYEFKDDMNYEFQKLKSQGTFDLERVIDDFVFMCFFVGNDFLPHLPTLEIKEGAIDYMMELYKLSIPQIGYLTDQGEVDFQKVRTLLHQMGEKEAEVFKMRIANEAVREEQFKRRDAEENGKNTMTQASKKEEAEKNQLAFSESAGMIALGKRSAPENLTEDQPSNIAVPPKEALLIKLYGNGDPEGQPENDHAEPENDELEPDDDESRDSGKVAANDLAKKNFDDQVKNFIRSKGKIENPFDNVRLGEDGWKNRYYKNKFGWDIADPSSRKNLESLLRSYYEGLMWVMRYYYQGCISWEWYYPYHYAPFASDLVNFSVSSEELKFNLGEPFTPLQQLMGVLPAKSAYGVLPDCYIKLMTEKSSPIYSYYPEDFEIDLNGKRFEWEGVAILPFVDATLLKNAMATVEDQLTPEDIERNIRGETLIYVHKDTSFGKFLKGLSRYTKVAKAEKGLVIGPKISGGFLFGHVDTPRRDTPVNPSVVVGALDDPPTIRHIPKLLENVDTLPCVLTDSDKYELQSGNTGWKNIRFGCLGQAAREFRIARARDSGFFQRRNNFYNQNRPGGQVSFGNQYNTNLNFRPNYNQRQPPHNGVVYDMNQNFNYGYNQAYNMNQNINYSYNQGYNQTPQTPVQSYNATYNMIQGQYASNPNMGQQSQIPRGYDQRNGVLNDTYANNGQKYLRTNNNNRVQMYNGNRNYTQNNPFNAQSEGGGYLPRANNVTYGNNWQQQQALASSFMFQNPNIGYQGNSGNSGGYQDYPRDPSSMGVPRSGGSYNNQSDNRNRNTYHRSK